MVMNVAQMVSANHMVKCESMLSYDMHAQNGTPAESVTHQHTCKLQMAHQTSAVCRPKWPSEKLVKAATPSSSAT